MEVTRGLSEPWPEYIPSPEFVASMMMMDQETSWYQESAMFVPQPSLVSCPGPTPSESLLHCTSPSELSPTSETSSFVQIETPRPTDPALQSRRLGRSKERGRKPGRRSRPESDDDIRRAKLAHSTVEQRYRDNLNFRLNQLRQTLENVGVRTGGRRNGDSCQLAAHWDCRSLKRKEDVLMDAMQYIQTAQVEMERLKAQLNALILGS